jgi:hypothetical protein
MAISHGMASIMVKYTFPPALFERLQAGRKRSAASAQKWARDAREQRRSASAKREPSGGLARHT